MLMWRWRLVEDRLAHSRAIFDVAPQNGWKLMTSGYALAEVSVNLPRLGLIATQEWARLNRADRSAHLIRNQSLSLDFHFNGMVLKIVPERNCLS